VRRVAAHVVLLCLSLSGLGCDAVWGITSLTIAPSQGDAGDSGEGGQADAPATFSPTRIAAGTTADYTDSFGNVWSKDAYFTGGTPFVGNPPLAIRLTNDPGLYNSQRYGDQAASFDYTLPVPNGSYVVTLYFAENDFSMPGQRRFDVGINGNSVLTEFDIAATTHGKLIPTVQSFPVMVGTGEVGIHFSAGSAQNPMVNAIEIELPPGTPPAPSKGFVSPDFFGMGFGAPGVDAWPPFYVSSFRAWDWSCKGDACQSASWAAIETARAVYDWTTVDAQLADVTAADPTAHIVWTFGGVPGWANGNQSASTPPSSLQDLYDFVQAVVSRYKGRVTDYECWNELDIDWGGSLAQMATICMNVQSIVHTTDPSARVLTPSVSGLGAAGTMQAYFEAGGAAYADVFNVHGHPAFTMPTRPEQVAYFASQMGALGKYYMPNAPFFVDEGSYGDAAAVATSQQPPFVAVYHALLASAGVGLSQWSLYDAPTDGSGAPLWDGDTTALGLGASGVAYRELEKWLIGATFTRPVVRQAGTNGVSNTAAAGATPGTPGTPPSKWSVYAPDSSNGITSEIVATGTEGAVPYIDWRVYGNATAGAKTYTQLTMQTPGAITTKPGETWTVCVDVRMVSGSLDAQGILVQANGFDSGGSYTETFFANPIEPLAKVPLGQQVHCASGSVGNASTTTVTPLVSVDYDVGSAFDVTLRIGAPAMDNATIWSGTITRPLPSGYQADIVWDAAGGPTPWQTTRSFARTGQGQSFPVQGGSVTLNNAPILLENVAGP
jgi:hypothetical protein